MTVTVYAMIMAIGIVLCTLFTECVKKFYQNADKKYSANIIALINAVIIGVVSTSFMYSFMDIPFSVNNILAMISVAFFIWIGSMIGFDKVIQSLSQIQDILNGGN